MKSYVYYDEKGILKEIYTAFNARNGDTDNSIYFICEKYLDGSLDDPDTIVKYRKPAKEGEEPSLDANAGVEIASEWVDETIPFDKDRTLQYLKYFNVYHMVKVSFSDLTPNGLWLITPQLDGVAYGVYTFFVENNTLGTDGSITSSDYQYLHDLINKLSKSVSTTTITYEDGNLITTIDSTDYKTYTTDYLYGLKWSGSTVNDIYTYAMFGDDITNLATLISDNKAIAQLSIVGYVGGYSEQKITVNIPLNTLVDNSAIYYPICIYDGSKLGMVQVRLYGVLSNGYIKTTIQMSGESTTRSFYITELYILRGALN